MSEADRDTALEAQVLDIVRAVVHELHPHRTESAVTLDSSLDRDLGLDSLARSELLLRISEATGIELADTLLGTAERPRDLVAGLKAAPVGRARAPSVAPAVSATASIEVPHAAKTLVDVLLAHATATPDRIHVSLYEGSSDAPRPISYGDLFAATRRVAAGLRRAGVEPGQVVAIMLPTSAAYLETFLGVLLAGGIALPIYPPERPSQLETHLERHGQILDNAQAKLLVAPAQAQPLARLLRNQALSLSTVVTPDALMTAEEDPFVAMPIGADDVAMLQYTSGSTGHPKGVVLTHAQLLANIRAMGTAIAAHPNDVFLSWLPLYHDMGLIGAWLGSLYFAMRLVLMPPTAFLGRPSRWLTRLHEHRATISGAPNFAYEVCVSRVRDEQITGIDLGSWRLAFNGAEPVSPNTIRRFAERFAKYGFRPQAMAPAYGLAEAGVCLTVPPLDRGPLFERVERDAYQRGGEALPARHGDASALEFVSSGQALPGYQLRIADDSGRELPDRREGRVEFRGPSATRGYMRNPEATERLFHGNWLDTGDLGYVVGGDLFITSRVKDLIKRAGRNIYPYEIEEAVGNLPGIRRGCVAAFGSSDAVARTEKLVVAAETIGDRSGRADSAARTDRPHSFGRARVRSRRRCAGATGFGAKNVERQDPPRRVPRIVRTRRSRATGEDRSLAGGAPVVGRRQQAAHLAQIVGRTVRTLGAIVFGTTAALLWTAVVLLPSKQLRWHAMRGAARLLFRLTAVPFTVRGLDHLPTRPCVCVSNHASYLDGVALVAALPTTLSFVVKGELAQQFFPRVFLRRIGASFVERFDAAEGRAGRTTHYPIAGDWRVGAVLPGGHADAYAGTVAVPRRRVRGRDRSRVCRSCRSRYAERVRSCAPISGSRIAAQFRSSSLAPVAAEGTDWQATVRLRERVRETPSSQRLGEPDLAHVVAPLTSFGQG